MRAGSRNPPEPLPVRADHLVDSFAGRSGCSAVTPHSHTQLQRQRYLGLKQNLHDAPCDRLGLVGWEE